MHGERPQRQRAVRDGQLLSQRTWTSKAVHCFRALITTFQKSTKTFTRLRPDWTNSISFNGTD